MGSLRVQVEIRFPAEEFSASGDLPGARSGTARELRVDAGAHGEGRVHGAEDLQGPHRGGPLESTAKNTRAR